MDACPGDINGPLVGKSSIQVSAKRHYISPFPAFSIEQLHRLDGDLVCTHISNTENQTTPSLDQIATGGNLPSIVCCSHGGRRVG